MNRPLLEKREHPQGFLELGGIWDRKRSRAPLKEPSVPQECLKTCRSAVHPERARTFSACVCVLIFFVYFEREAKGIQAFLDCLVLLVTAGRKATG